MWVVELTRITCSVDLLSKKIWIQHLRQSLVESCERYAVAHEAKIVALPGIKLSALWGLESILVTSLRKGFWFSPPLTWFELKFINHAALLEFDILSDQIDQIQSFWDISLGCETQKNGLIILQLLLTQWNGSWKKVFLDPCALCILFVDDALFYIVIDLHYGPKTVESHCCTSWHVSLSWTGAL